MNRSFLAEIIERKREAVARLQHASAQPRAGIARHRFRAAFARRPDRANIIAEFKRRSPALGAISETRAPGQAAAAYERGGAAAMSVLTDPDYFGGSIDDLVAARDATSLPILRKDFVVDAKQIHEAANAGADAILLIVAALDHDSLGRLRSVAENELGIDAIVEVHDEQEMERAIDCGAKIIGVNNRDLRTFQVDLATSERLIGRAPADALLIAESGIHSREDIVRLQNAGYRGFLIGEALMRSGDPEGTLRDFLS